MSRDDKCRSAVAERGGIDAVVSAMGAHGGSVAVAEEACRTLKLVAFNKVCLSLLPVRDILQGYLAQKKHPPP